MKFPLIYLAAILAIHSLSFSQWEDVSINSIESLGQASAIDAYDSLNATICYRNIYITFDGGLNWKKTESLEKNFSDIEMLTPLKICAVTFDGGIFLSTDSGESFRETYLNKSKTSFFNYVEFFDETNGIAMGDAINSSRYNDILFLNDDIGWAAGIPLGSGYRGIIDFTTDGGATWQNNQSDLSAEVNGIYALDENLVWVVSSRDTLLKSIDGGNNWEEIEITGDPYNKFNSVYFINGNIGFVGGDGILKSNDGGNSWVEILQSTPNMECTKIEFSTESNGFAFEKASFSKNAKLLKTTDQGITWAKVHSGYNNGFTLINENAGIVYGDSLFATSDGGNSWNLRIALTDNAFLDAQLIGNNYIIALDGNNTLYKSVDLFETYETFTIETDRDLSKISFTDSSNGILTGESRIILKTTDAGLTWTETQKDTLPTAIFLHTTDGGNTWFEKGKNNFAQCYSFSTWVPVDFISPDIGYYIPSGKQNGLYKTVDGGLNWEKLPLDFSSGYGCVEFYNSDIGICYGIQDDPTLTGIYTTTDGGSTWSLHENHGWLFGLYYVPITPQNIYAITMGSLMFSTNGGLSFSEHPLTNNDIFDLIFTDQNTGWLVGDEGKVFKTTNLSLTSAEPENGIPRDYMLYQNYPNPFNPSTIIKYHLPETGNVKIVVYDLLGRIVETLLDGNKPAGSYEIKFDGSNLSTGLYFYSLETGNYRDVKKMVLLK